MLPSTRCGGSGGSRQPGVRGHDEQVHALVAEAMKKAAVVWVAGGFAPQDAPTAMWCLPVGDALYVVSGGNEQPAPGLADGGQATVTARGDHGGRIVDWPVLVTRIAPGTPDWDGIAVTLAGKRLNASGTAEALAASWAEQSTIWRLEPIGDDVDGG